MKAAGAWVFAGGLHPPSSATVVRAQGGDVLMTDGPFVEGKEHIGGFSIVMAPDLDAALEWGRKLARAITLPIEVRPFQEERTDAVSRPAVPPRRSSVCSVRNTGARSRSWCASSATSTSPKRQYRTHSPRRCNAGRRTGFRRARRAGSSRPHATGRSTAFAGRPPARTDTRRPRCCTPATRRSRRRRPCATIGCA